jgi:hypothetical protein
MVSPPIFDAPHEHLAPPSESMAEALPKSQAFRINREFCHAPRALKLMRRFMAETACLCRASEATFWVISDNGKQIEGAVNCGKDHDRVEKLVVHANDSVVGLIATAGISLCVGPGEFMNPEIKKEFSVRNMVVAPVAIDSQICGVVSAINATEGEKFKAEDLEALQWRAYLMGLVLSDLVKCADND